MQRDGEPRRDPDEGSERPAHQRGGHAGPYPAKKAGDQNAGKQEIEKQPSGDEGIDRFTGQERSGHRDQSNHLPAPQRAFVNRNVAYEATHYTTEAAQRFWSKSWPSIQPSTVSGLPVHICYDAPCGLLAASGTRLAIEA